LGFGKAAQNFGTSLPSPRKPQWSILCEMISSQLFSALQGGVRGGGHLEALFDIDGGLLGANGIAARRIGLFGPAVSAPMRTP
jgi:hypothetical protein